MFGNRWFLLGVPLGLILVISAFLFGGHDCRLSWASSFTPKLENDPFEGLVEEPTCALLLNLGVPGFFILCMSVLLGAPGFVFGCIEFLRNLQKNRNI